MGKVQELVHVVQHLPPTADQVWRVSACHDTMCRIRISRYRCDIKYVARFNRYSLMLTCLSAEYNKERSRITDATGNQEHFSSSDLVGAFSYNIFVGIYVATIFGAAFFFDLFWPERQESATVRMAWKACSALTIVFTLSSAILLSVIIATRHAFLGGGFNITEFDPPLEYNRNGEAIAALVLLWLGWLATIWRYVKESCSIVLWISKLTAVFSTYLMWTNTDYIYRNGPFSTHVKKDLESKGFGELAEKPPGSTNPGDKALHGDTTAAYEAGYNLPDRSPAPKTPATPQTPLPAEAITYMRTQTEPKHASPTA